METATRSRDQLPQHDERDRPADAREHHDQVDDPSPVPVLLEDPREHQAADEEREHHAEIDQAIRLGAEVVAPDLSIDRQEERLGHQHRRGRDDREERWAFGLRRDRRAAPPHDRTGDQRDRRPHEVHLADDVPARRADRVVDGDPHQQGQGAGERTTLRRRREAADEERREPPRRSDVPEDPEQPPADDPVREDREGAEPYADHDRDRPQTPTRSHRCLLRSGETNHPWSHQ